MANEFTPAFGSVALDSTNDISIASIDFTEQKPVREVTIPKTDGSLAQEIKRKSIKIAVQGDVIGSGYDALRTQINLISAGFQDGKQKFTLDNDRYMMAQLTSFNYSLKHTKELAQWKATFLANFPFWLDETASQNDSTPTSGSGYTVNNPGNAPARVKVTASNSSTALNDSFQIVNSTRGETLIYRGDVTIGDDLVIDNRYATEYFAVTNDGEDDIKNFEGDFLVLDPGDNTIVFTGTANTRLVLDYRGTWW